MTDKNYTVLDSNGTEIKTVKSLSIAKKLANTEKGSVICDGECVYQCPAEVEKPTEKPTEDEKTHELEKPAEPETYRIKELMNIRSAPSLTAQKLGTISPGTDVAVVAIEDNWLHLADGTFVLYDNGKYAERIVQPS